ncbi:MAG: Na+/melibiose symporter-like transporter [Paenibacillus sp.]|jgi:PPP family 3-phenylpropionic acid transporter|nr:Na+/melibiose symporter-like transporter [Paenibacillus sp.]
MVRISLFIFLLFSTFSIMSFFFPPLLQSKGLSSVQIGNILACGSLIAIFGQPIWGYVSDKTKTVKPILLILLTAGFFVSLGVFSSTAFISILLFYTMFSFFNSSSGPLAETLCIAYANQNNKDYGRIRLWGEVGVGISALLLGMIVDRIGIQHLGLIYTVSICIAVTATSFLKNTEAASAPVNLSALTKLIVNPKLLWFLFLILMIGIPHRMNDSMLAIYLDRLGATETQLGMAWLVATLSTVPALMFIGNLMRKWNELGILIIAALAYTVRWAIYSQADSPGVLIASQLLHSITFPLFLVASIQYVFSIVPAELRATGQSAFAVVFGGLGGVIGSSAGGYMMDHLGPHIAYGAGSILAFIGAAAAAATYIFERRKPLRPDLKTAKQADI